MIGYKYKDKFMNESKKSLCHGGALGRVIVALLGFILIILVFKAGMLVGGFKSHLSSYKEVNHHKSFRGHLWKGGFSNLMDQKKVKIEALKAGAEFDGMTIEEFKKYLIEQKTTE